MHMQTKYLLFGSLLLSQCFLALADKQEELYPSYTCTVKTTVCKRNQDIIDGRPSYVSEGRSLRIRSYEGFGPKIEKDGPCACQIQAEEEIQELWNELRKEKAEREELVKKIEALSTPYPASCEEYNEIERRFGRYPPNDTQVKIYPLKTEGILTPVMKDCSQRSKWKVIQRRKDGSVDFYRDWQSYENGFGDPSGEYWIGLHKLHLLTNLGHYKLRIDLEDWEGAKKYAEYSLFQVGDKESKYKLTVGGYSGNAGDRLTQHNGDQFTTYDVDNDNSGSNCAVLYSGAWWYQRCYFSNLNGKYFKFSEKMNARGIVWKSFHSSFYSLKFVEMKIQPLE